MNKRQEQKEKTRKQIRRVAKRLFEEQGYEATTSRQIAEASGVALGTIFLHFSDKSAMLANILYEDIEVTVADAFLHLPTKDKLLDKLLFLATELYSYYLKHPDLSRVLLQNSMFHQTDAAFSNQVKGFVRAIAQLIEQAKGIGEIRQDKDAEAMAHLFMAAYLFVLLALLRGELTGLEQARKRLELLIQTIFA